MADIPILNRRSYEINEQHSHCDRRLRCNKILNGLRNALISKSVMSVSDFKLPVIIECDDEIKVDLFIPSCPPVVVYCQFADNQPPVPYGKICNHFGQACNYWILSENKIPSGTDHNVNYFEFTDNSDEQIETCANHIVEFQRLSRQNLFQQMDDSSSIKKYSSTEIVQENYENDTKHRIGDNIISISMSEEKIQMLLTERNTVAKKEEIKEINDEIEECRKNIDRLRVEIDELNATQEEPESQVYLQERKKLFGRLQELEAFNFKTPSCMILLIAEALLPADGIRLLKTYNRLLNLFFDNYYDMAVLMMGKLVEKILYTLCSNWGVKVVSGVFTYINDFKKKAEALQRAVVTKSFVRDSKDNPLQILKEIQYKTTDIAYSLGKGDLPEKLITLHRTTYSLLTDLMKICGHENNGGTFEKEVFKLLNKIMDERNMVAHFSSDDATMFTATRVDDVLILFSRLLFGFSYLIQEFAVLTSSKKISINTIDA